MRATISAGDGARERYAAGHRVHVVMTARIKSHMSGGAITEWADQIEEIEREGWRLSQLTPTGHGDMMIFRRVQAGGE